MVLNQTKPFSDQTVVLAIHHQPIRFIKGKPLYSLTIPMNQYDQLFVET